ncbi:MAG: acyl carrier protein [Clostridia bacterium]|nr:acyl carrier protein [Clostridia bacterium]
MDERQKVLDALTEVRDDVDFENETELVDDGVIDSLDLTQMIAALDEAFGIHIPSGEIEPENFNNLDAIIELVHKYQEA